MNVRELIDGIYDQLMDNETDYTVECVYNQQLEHKFPNLSIIEFDYRENVDSKLSVRLTIQVYE